MRSAHVLQQTGQVELDVDLVPSKAEAVEATISDFFGNQDACHCDHRYRRTHRKRSELNDLFNQRTTRSIYTRLVVAQHDAVEQWFLRRGVPHFIERDHPVAGLWSRALPLLLIFYVVGGLNALDVRTWTWQRNVAAAAFTVVLLAATWIAANLLRRRPAWSRPRTIGVPELVVFVVGPTVPSLVFGQYGDAAEAFVAGLTVLAAIFLITSYGVLPLMGWALRRSAAQLSVLGRMIVRALPLLLLFTTFLFINAEVWQLAGTLAGPAYIATLAIFFVLGSVFVLSRIPSLMTGLNDFADWTDVATLVHGTPAEHFDLPNSGPPKSAPLNRRQRVNIGMVSVFSQALQVTFVAVLLAGFFVLFGFLSIPTVTAEAWTQTDNMHVLATWTISGRDLVITEPLLRVAGFLGAFTGMYFTVVLSTDATYRDEFAEDVAPQIRQALAVRLAARWNHDAGKVVSQG